MGYCWSYPHVDLAGWLTVDAAGWLAGLAGWLAGWLAWLATVAGWLGGWRHLGHPDPYHGRAPLFDPPPAPHTRVPTHHHPDVHRMPNHLPLGLKSMLADPVHTCSLVELHFPLFTNFRIFPFSIFRDFHFRGFQEFPIFSGAEPPESPWESLPSEPISLKMTKITENAENAENHENVKNTKNAENHENVKKRQKPIIRRILIKTVKIQPLLRSEIALLPVQWKVVKSATFRTFHTFSRFPHRGFSKTTTESSFRQTTTGTSKPLLNLGTLKLSGGRVAGSLPRARGCGGLPASAKTPPGPLKHGKTRESAFWQKTAANRGYFPVILTNNFPRGRDAFGSEIVKKSSILTTFWHILAHFRLKSGSRHGAVENTENSRWNRLFSVEYIRIFPSLCRGGRK